MLIAIALLRPVQDHGHADPSVDEVLHVEEFRTAPVGLIQSPLADRDIAGRIVGGNNAIEIEIAVNVFAGGHQAVGAEFHAAIARAGWIEIDEVEFSVGDVGQRWPSRVETAGSSMAANFAHSRIAASYFLGSPKASRPVRVGSTTRPATFLNPKLGCR